METEKPTTWQRKYARGESLLNPLWLFEATINDDKDCFDLEPFIDERFTRAIDPDYEEAEKELAGEGGSSNAGMCVRLIERKAYFGIGFLFGMKMSGRSAEEIRKMAVSMVSRQRKTC